jgi:hypothetical protein
MTFTDPGEEAGMRKALVTATTVAAMMFSSAAQAQSPVGDSVTGAGHVLLTDFIVSVSIKPGNFGIPSGTLNLSGYVQGAASPSCLRVSGHTAVAAFTLVGGPNDGRGFIAEIVDNGPPVNGHPVDRITYAGYVDPGPPTVCPAPGGGPPAGLQSVGAGPFTSGDVTVHDATGLPALGNDGVAGVIRDCLHIDFYGGWCDHIFFLDTFVESGPLGENPRGYLDWENGGPTPNASTSGSATITCLSVSGHVAILGVTGKQDHFYSNSFKPIAGLIRIVDGGGPDSEADNVKFAIQIGAKFGSPLPGPTNCSSFPGGYPPPDSFAFPDSTNELGDLTVVDAQPPLPTSKDQCKNGGWKTYRVFKNPGDCISYVATKGKNQPAR